MMRACHNGSGPDPAGGAGPYMLTICGIPLNQVPPRWQDQLPDWP